MSADTVAAHIRPPFGLILMLGTMSVFGALSINMYIPAIPLIAKDLASDTPTIQDTVATFMVGLATGQIFWGAASERLGRRPPVLLGFALFLLASFACAVAPTAPVLLVARLFQGLGACAGMVLARAIVSDNFEGSEAAVIFSWQHLIMGVAPIFAPLIGGFLLVSLGWRSIFWLLFSVAALLLCALWIKLPESRSEEVAIHARSESRLAAYWRILENKPILGHVLTGGFSAATLMTWYSGVSPLFEEDFGWSAGKSSAVISILGITIIAGTQINRPLLARHSPRRIIDAALIGGMICLAIALILTLLHSPGAHAIVAAGLILGASCYGFISANNQACAFAYDKKRSGSISALIGSANYGVGAALAAFLALLPSGHGIAMLTMMTAELLISYFALKFLAPYKRTARVASER